jgi:two-component system nitrogen regulation response regulator NtrX
VSVAPSILLIAAESGDREGLLSLLHLRGHSVTVLETAALARTAIAEMSTEGHVIVLDLADAEALRLLRAPAVHRGGIPVICIADRRKPETASEALRLGIADLVARPITADDLAAAIANAGEFARAAKGLRREPAPGLELPADSVFGASPAIREVLALVRRIAPSRCHVLVLGERGTGREMVARAVHAQSPRRDKPFLKIDCSGSAVDLDAVLDGRTSDGATVYLKDVNELSEPAQRRLTDVLRRPAATVDDSARRPVGDLRFIGATPPRVADWIDRGLVRADLVEALGVVRIDLPALRQRADDVPLLASHFLKEACRRNGIAPKTFTRSALVLLAALPWPGNAEELRALTERLSVLISRGVVLLEDVLAHVRLDSAEAVGRTRGTLREARERFERDYVASVLQHHHGRMGAAARELGIERTNLYRKIKQLNIRWTAGSD